MTQSMLDKAMQHAKEVTESETDYHEPQPKREYKSHTVAQITHFYDKKPNTLQIEEETPYLDDKGYPKNGIIKIRLKKEDSNVAFNLSSAEAFELSAILKQVAKEHIVITKSLWRR